MPYRNRSFGAAVTCIDGRAHGPLTEWVRAHAGVHFVDLVTEPGADVTLAECPRGACEAIRERLEVSIAAHESEVVVIAGHDDCAANPVAPHVHREHIVEAVEAVRSWGLEVPVVGVWISEDGRVEELAVTD